MAAWQMNGNGADLANQGGQGGGGGDIREGTYTFKVESFKEEKTLSGDDKFSVLLKIVAQDDGGNDMIGQARTQHFVVGHKKEAVAAGYRADCLAMLRALGATDAQLNALTSQMDVFMLGYSLSKGNATCKYFVKPQAKDNKYYDWRLVIEPSGAVETSSLPTQPTKEIDPLFA